MNRGNQSYRRSFLKRRPQGEEMALQITSMADIFTIILVFLLKSYSTGAASLSPAKGMTLPQANAAEATVEALKIEIGEGGIQVEGQSAGSLQAFNVPKEDLDTNGTSKQLNEVLKKSRARQLLIAKNNTSVKVDSKVVILADQRVPYSTLKTVLASAAVQGYTDFKLAVVHGD